MPDDLLSFYHNRFTDILEKAPEPMRTRRLESLQHDLKLAYGADLPIDARHLHESAERAKGSNLDSVLKGLK